MFIILYYSKFQLLSSQFILTFFITLTTFIALILVLLITIDYFFGFFKYTNFISFANFSMFNNPTNFFIVIIFIYSIIVYFNSNNFDQLYI